MINRSICQENITILSIRRYDNRFKIYDAKTDRNEIEIKIFRNRNREIEILNYKQRFQYSFF